MADKQVRQGEGEALPAAPPVNDDLYVVGDPAVAAAVILVGWSLADLSDRDFG